MPLFIMGTIEFPDGTKRETSVGDVIEIKTAGLCSINGEEPFPVSPGDKITIRSKSEMRRIREMWRNAKKP